MPQPEDIIRRVALTLDNVAEGKAAQLFQQFLPEVDAVFQESHRFRSNRDGEVSARMLIEVEFTRTALGTVETGVTGTFKPPKSKTSSGVAYRKHGVFTVDDVEQLDLAGVEPVHAEEGAVEDEG